MAKEVDESIPAAKAEIAAKARADEGDVATAPKTGSRGAKDAASIATEGDEQKDPQSADLAKRPTSGDDAHKSRQNSGGRRDGVFVDPWYVKKGSEQLRRRIQNVSMPFLKSRMTLKTEQAQNIFERSSTFWEEAMITLSVTMRNFKPEDQCLHVDAEADRLLDECVKVLDTERKRLMKLAENNGIDLEGELEIEYTKPKSYEFNLSSPRETRFHKMIRDFDAFCIFMDLLWMMKIVPDRERANTFYKLKRSILSTSGRIRNLVYRAQASSQRKGIQDAQDPRVGTALDPSAKINYAAQAFKEAEEKQASKSISGISGSAEKTESIDPVAQQAQSLTEKKDSTSGAAA
jgi:hypothetical protein